MAKKKSFVLRLNEEDFAAIEKWSADEFRSANAQIEYLLHQALLKAKRLKQKKTQSTDED